MESINQKPLKGQTFYKSPKASFVEQLNDAFEKINSKDARWIIDDHNMKLTSYHQKVTEEEIVDLIDEINKSKAQ